MQPSTRQPTNCATIHKNDMTIQKELEEIQQIADHIRRQVKRWVKNDPSISSDLTGACAIASNALWQTLRLLGYDKANLVCVSTIDYGHCWVEYRGSVIDITASQFAGPEIAIFKRREAPSWFKTETWGRRRWNEHALKEVWEWGSHSPINYQKQTERLVESFRVSAA